jgi:peroxiredoxin
MKRAHVWWAAVVLAWLGVTLYVKALPELDYEDFMPKEGSPAPDFTLPGLDGKTVALADFRGKVVALNFFASWCGPCARETPGFQKFYEAHASEGFVVLGVNMGEGVHAVERFVRKYAVTYPVVLDEREETARRYGVSAIPVTVLIDREGVIRYREAGMVTLGQGRMADMLAEMGVLEQKAIPEMDGDMAAGSAALLSRLACICGSGKALTKCGCGRGSRVYEDFIRWRQSYTEDGARSFGDEEILQMLKWKYDVGEVTP